MTNVETVQQIYEAFGRGDIPFILDRIAADAGWEEWEDHSAQKAGVEHLMARRGPAGAAEFFGVIGTFQFNDFQVLALLDGGDNVGAEITLDVTLPNGNHLRDEEFHLWSFDEQGKVRRFRHYVDTAKHIAAIQGK
jgi:ketosteroid isomerase-like protein